MRLVRINKASFVFEISPTDKLILFETLKQYPLVPMAHHRLTKGDQIPDQEANQQLLEELLKAQRVENQKLLEETFNDPARFKPCDKGFHFKLSRAEIEWLLQVANDVRIGSWIALGSPEEGMDRLPTDGSEVSPYFIHMTVAAHIEMILLMAIDGSEPSQGGSE